MDGSPKILITGGFGNLGSWLSEYFYHHGYQVTILSKNKRELKGIEYSCIQADISDYKQLKAKLTDQYDFCIHTASYNEYFHDDYAEKALRVNTLGTRNLIDVLHDNGLKKFIYFSTFHIYGNGYTYIDESSQPLPLNDYASTHLFAEYYLKQFHKTVDFPYIICRLTNSYGTPKYRESTKWYLVLNDLVKSAYENGEIVIRSNGEAIRDFIWMGDVCKIAEKLLYIDENSETYNLSSGQNYRVIDIANRVKDIYMNRYRKEINILINDNDTTMYQKIEVDNHKLLKSIDFHFSNKIDEEIENIFDLLEEPNE